MADKLDFKDKIYEENRKVFYRLVEEIRAFEDTLGDNQELHAFINGVEFCLEKISIINTRSDALPVFLAFYGLRPSGEQFLHVQSLTNLNLSLSPSRKEDAKSLRHKVVIEEFDKG